MIKNDYSSFGELVRLALEEDLGAAGDITSQGIFGMETGKARIIAKEQGIISGIGRAETVFCTVDPATQVTVSVEDGNRVHSGETVCTVRGTMRALLSAERVALNILAYLSGIATAASRYQTILAEYGNTRILDTRKTLPGYRQLAKDAVVHGGGKNHRFGLYDMIMIKDNHIDAAGGITIAVQKVRNAYNGDFQIEVECRNLQDVREALSLGVDMIMLDNMGVADCIAALKIRHDLGSDIPFEASGDMNEDTIKAYAGLGLEYISSGALTHSVKSLNLSMLYSRE